MKDKKIPILKGQKGGSQSVRTPVEDPNTLQSRAVAKFVDLLSEGEVEGLVNGENSIFFNNVPIRGKGSNYNFKGVETEFKPGAPDSVSLKDFPTSESEISVETQLTKKDGAVVRNIPDADIDDLKFTFTIPSLFKVNPSNGDIKKYEVRWRIDIRQVGGYWRTAANINKRGKCISSYQLSLIHI